MTGRALGSTARYDRGAAELTCTETRQPVPLSNGGTRVSRVRLWEMRGLNGWTDETASDMVGKLDAGRAEPVCVFYCTAGTGRVDKRAVESVLRRYHGLGALVFWIVTQRYSLSNEQFHEQWADGKATALAISGHPALEVADGVLSSGSRCFVVTIDSKPFDSQLLGVHREPKNVDALMRICVQHLEGADVARFFAATKDNVGFWAGASDQCRRALSALGIAT